MDRNPKGIGKKGAGHTITLDSGAVRNPPGPYTYPPAPAQTNGMVERFNGRITEVLAAVPLRNREALEAALTRYRRLDNHHIPQKALNGQAPVDFLKSKYEEKPELFKRPVRKLARPDRHPHSRSLPSLSGRLW